MPVSEFVVTKRYDTGLASHYKANDLEFEWIDWLFCEISWSSGNPNHFCIASSFRSGKDKKGNLHMTCIVMNPSYDSEVMSISLDKLYHFKPIRVVHVPKQERAPHLS